MRITLLKFVTLFVLVCGPAVSVHAAWYWPFDFNPDSTNKPPRLHRLLEKANEYIELAEDDALEGNGDKAIANYRLALKELDRVEEENPDRAESPEFAPLRTKRATCTAAIDSIRFAQVNDNERAVAVSNTRDLERKWRFKHGLQTRADEEFMRQETVRTNKAEVAETSVASNKVAEVGESDGIGTVTTNKVEKAAAKSQVASAAGGGKGRALDNTEGVANGVEAHGDFDSRMRQAMGMFRGGDYAGADLAFEQLLKDRPRDLNLLLLRAAAQAGGGSLFAARRTLEKTMRLHPKSYLPCYNLANLMLRIDRNSDVAREYYEMGRKLGGPRNEGLEKRMERK